MHGQPVWLVSLSHTSLLTRKKILVPRWPASWRPEAETIMRDVLGPAGDPAQERIFRMNLTICLHRAASPAEVAVLPPSFHRGAPQGIAGAPVEVLWENVEGALSTKPCDAPTRIPIPGHERDPDGWIPQECGACPSCQARVTA